MNTLRVCIIGLLLSIVGIYILAAITENGDTNAISMYYAVFLLPTIMVVVINFIYLLLLGKMTGKTVKIFLGLVLVMILIILSLKNQLIIQGIDGDLTFVAIITAISIGITNLIWIGRQVKTKAG